MKMKFKKIKYSLQPRPLVMSHKPLLNSNKCHVVMLEIVHLSLQYNSVVMCPKLTSKKILQWEIICFSLQYGSVVTSPLI